MLNMSAESLIVLVVVGAVAGWLAGMVMKGKKRGVVVNSIVGIVGAFVGGFVFNFFGVAVAHGILGDLFTAFIGAVIFLWLVSLLR